MKQDVASHPVYGVILFFISLWLVFTLTFILSAPLSAKLSAILAGASGLIPALPLPWIDSLLRDGILRGVGTVLLFLPQIMILFFCLAFLELSGYLQRASLVMGRLLEKIGISGQAFLPMVMSFGCNVPAILATKSIADSKTRIQTILLIPFMSCSARLPVYILFTGLLFPGKEPLVIMSLYALGLLFAVLTGIISQRVFRIPRQMRVLRDVAPYRLPSLKELIARMWSQALAFLKNAGTMVVLIVVVIWFAANLPWGVAFASQESLIGRLGSAIAPLFAPLGFGTWQAAVGLLTGFVGKEVIIGVLATLYPNPQVAIAQAFTPLSAYAFLVFVLLYLPCIATFAVIKAETNWKWATASALYGTALAYLMSLLIYQGGSLLWG
ncbi:MAG: ferrous iron transport protein B [Nanoarchaeota archaeon]|nr:ferrous iron transport protein B [Nanoarchaeota archaeon]